MPAIEMIQGEQSAESLTAQNEDRPGELPVESVDPGGGDLASHLAAGLAANSDTPASLKPAHTPARTPSPARGATVRLRRRRYAKTAARTAANRANAKKSTGPRTVRGMRRASRNLPDPHASRLMGLVEARLFDQQPGAAEKLYREIIRPYEPAPPLLAMHFHDLARLHLELEAWQRIRDAQIEERWRQADIELRRRLHTLHHDLPSMVAEVFEKGLAGLPESPARLEQQVQYLWALRQHLERRDFDIEPLLQKLYGQALNPNSDRAQTICMRCDRLMHPEGREPLTDEQYEGLIILVALEQQDATAAYGLYLDDASMPPVARLARLGPSAPDRPMNLQGERLRQAIDRKQRVITSLLRALDARRDKSEDASRCLAQDPGLQAAAASRKTQKKNLNLPRPKPLGPLESAKRRRKRAKSGVAKAIRARVRG